MIKEKANRLVITITDIDGEYTQNWQVRDTPELWEFLNKYAQMGSSNTLYFAEKKK